MVLIDRFKEKKNKGCERNSLHTVEKEISSVRRVFTCLISHEWLFSNRNVLCNFHNQRRENSENANPFSTESSKIMTFLVISMN
jgi:hypothetical protein